MKIESTNKRLHTVVCGGLSFTHQGGKKEALEVALRAVEFRVVTNPDTSTEVSAKVGGKYIKRIYWGYSRTVAAEKFKAEVL